QGVITTRPARRAHELARWPRRARVEIAWQRAQLRHERRVADVRIERAHLGAVAEVEQPLARAVDEPLVLAGAQLDQPRRALGGGIECPTLGIGADVQKEPGEQHEGEQSSTHDAQQFHQERPPTSVATSLGQYRTDAAEDRAELRSHCVERAAIGVPERQSPSRYPNGQELTNDRWSLMIANR